MKPDEQWFDDFVDDTRVALTAYVNRITGSRDDAQEVVQEAYLKVYCALSSGVQGHQPAALLYTTARNIAISRQRHDTVVARSETAVTVFEELRTARKTTEQQAGRREQLQMLLLAVNKLPPKCRSVFVMRMIEGLSQQAIGERLGIAVSTVEKHLSRGLRLCRSEILAAEALPAEPAESRPVARAAK